MATLLIRNLDDAVRDKLRVRAAERGHSMEEEARSILADAIETAEIDPDSLPGSGATLVAELQAIFADLSAEEVEDFVAGGKVPSEAYEPPPVWDDEDEIPKSMIVLDTNVVSELYRPGGAPSVVAWASAQPRTSLFMPSPVMGEIRLGVVQTPAGRRRDDLAKRYDAVRNVFRNNILALDLRAAEAFADIVAERRRAGAPIQLIDAQIAAIAKSRNAAVATRDVADFAGCGVTIIDPWAFAG